MKVCCMVQCMSIGNGGGSMIRKWIKGIVKEALIEWEQEVEYLGRTGYKWENNQWVPTETQPLRLDEIQE